MSNTKSILSGVSVEDLVSELLTRREVVCSIWNKDDITPLIDEDSLYQDLSDEEKDELALTFLNEIGQGLQDVLGSRGNDYTADKWESLKETYLEEFGQSAFSSN